MLSKTKYAGLCLFGVEVFYVFCLGYGSLLSVQGRELHQALFQLIPGFVWRDAVSMVWGAVYIGILAWIVGWYVAWMHNISLISADKLDK